MPVEILCMGCMSELNTEDVDACPKCGYRLSAENPSRGLQPRTILNEKYLVGRVIGEGGFGITYIGFDLILNSRIAIKEYFPVELATRDTTVGAQTSLTVLTGGKEEQYKKGIERFVNEASNLAKFNGLSGIVSVRDFFYENNTAYMVMEYIDGMTLTEYLKQNGDMLPYNTVLEMMKPVMDSLQKVHEAGIIHRDISPDNIMVTKTGEVKLIDFGAARFVGNEDQKSLTVILKHGYAPQEQYQTNGKQGPWTDVYALTATMYRMITGIVPQESTERILSGDTVVPVNKLVADAPKSVSEAIMHGMAVNVPSRCKGISEFSQELAGKRKKTFRWISSFVVGVIILVLIVGGIIAKQINSEIKNNKDEEFVENVRDSNVLSEPKSQMDADKMLNNLSEADVEVVDHERQKAELVEKIEAKSGYNVVSYEYDDFNADGVYEVLACLNKPGGSEENWEGSYEIWIADEKNTECLEVMEACECTETQIIQHGKSKHFVVRGSDVYEGLHWVCIYVLSPEKKLLCALDAHGDGCEITDSKTYITVGEPSWMWVSMSYFVNYEIFYLDDKYWTFDATEVSIDYIDKNWGFDRIVGIAETAVKQFLDEDIYYSDNRYLVMKSMWIDENNMLYMNINAWDSQENYRKNKWDYYDNRPTVEQMHVIFDLSSVEPVVSDVCEGYWELPSDILDVHNNEKIESIRKEMNDYTPEDRVILNETEDVESESFSMTSEELDEAIKKIREYYYTPSDLDFKHTTKMQMNGKTYSLELYYHEGELCFAFAFDKKEEHRLYFRDNQMIRYIDENGVIYDLEQSDGYRDWADAVLEEAY